MKSNYSKLHEKDYQSLYEKYEASQIEIKELKDLIKDLKLNISLSQNLKDSINKFKSTIKEQAETINKLTEQNQKLLDEIERLKNNNKKDSSNSSKPSSTNGSKIIPNNRTKSNKKQGGQVNHAPHTLKEKDMEKIIKDGAVQLITESLSDNCPKYIYDLAVQIVVTQNTNPNYDKLNPVQYGKTIKSLAIILSTNNYMSYDQIVEFIKTLTNNTVVLSKGTLVNWCNEFSKGIENERNKIENDLLNGYYIQADDSQIKINNKNHYQLCLCNPKSVLLYAKTNKSYESWKETALSRYVNGIIMKDGTRVFNEFNLKLAQCNVHISRYLKGAYEFSNSNHKAPKKMISFLNEVKNERDKLISKGISSFSNNELEKYNTKYDEIIKEWGIELDSESKVVYEEEIKLFNRMKGKDKEEILFFMNDFKIPFTNNNAESAQRGIKIKQKIGKFRSLDGAEAYCNAKSFILTLKKRGLSVIDSIRKILNNEPVLD